MTLAPLIGFDGPIGAGKTTIAGLLARHTGYELVLERFDENDYLADYYADRLRWALPMQLWFLAERHKQLEQLATYGRPATIADYTGIKNDVFATMLLKGRDSRLYTNLATSLSRVVRAPDILVYLDARDEILLDRIRMRARAYEATIDAAYLQNLREAYTLEMSRRPELNVLKIDTSALNIESPAELNELFGRILKSV
jgi:deoxyadenosine/deoxycytidine kinase